MIDLSLRAFLEYLKEKNELITIEKEVSVKHEIAAYIRKSCDTNGPCFLFSNVKDYPNRHVCGGIYGNKRRMGLALGFKDKKELTPRESMLEYVKAMENYSRGKQNFDNETYETKSPRLSPCKEVIETKPDLTKLAHCTYNEKDKGSFITAGVQVVRDDIYGTHGIGIHRMHIIDETHLSCLAPIERRVGKPYYRASEKGKSIPITIIIGAPPALMLASQAKIPHSDDKYAVMRELQGQPLQLVECETSEILIPADSEIIIEGHTIPNSSYDDTPFGEYCGVSSMRTNAWVVEVDCITHRAKPYIYEALLTGMPPQEDSNLCGVSTSAYIFDDLRKGGSEILDVSVYLGNNVFDSWVSIKKRNNSEVLNLIYRALGNNYIKTITIVDDDIDVNSTYDRLYSWNTRVQPNRDLVITGQMHGASLDPSGPLFRSTSKLGVDATIPIGTTKEDTLYNKLRHEKVRVPGSGEVAW
jgi:UbiD family decarboxylase